VTAEIKSRQKADAIEAEQIRHIVEYPLDLPSIERQIWHGGNEPAFSSGAQWSDKPHRVINDAISEIRALRKYILANVEVTNPDPRKS